jgi:N-acetylglucosaminyldiphosphoundecaprenol N-acetyl-beta-D-mannosaminyltransferase
MAGWPRLMDPMPDRATTLDIPVLPSERLFGIDVNVVDGDGALAWVAGTIEAGGRGLVLTPNVDHVVRFQRDPVFRQAYSHATLILPDSTPLMWAARILGRPLAERASNLMLDLCAAAAQRGHGVYLLGGTEDVVEGAVASLRSRFPLLRIAGRHHGYFGPEDEADVVAEISTSRPDLLFVGLGSPKQELWMARYGSSIDHRVAVCVGGAFNYVSGRVSRAPAWVQRAGIEWLWRLGQEPGRLWHRYFVEDATFIRLVAAEYLATRRPRPIGRPASRVPR